MKKISTILVWILAINIVKAQVNDPTQTVKDKATDRVNQKSDDLIDEGLNQIEDGINSIFKKKDKKEKKKKTDSNSDSSTHSGNQQSNSNSANTNSKFDFVPGNKVLYFDDFQRLNIGDFPAEFNTNASGEVVNVEGIKGKWLSLTQNGAFIPEIIKELPENFTLEFEVGIIGEPSNNYSGFGINFTTNQDDLFKDILFNEGTSVVHLHPGADMAFVSVLPSNGGSEISNEIKMPQWSVQNKNFAKISIWRQGGRLRVYVNEDKLLDMPRFFIENKPYKLAFFRRFFYDCEILITNIRYAIAGEDTRNKLMTEGKFVTTGIQFDVNSDMIKPESGPVLKEIATILQENPTVKIKIIGHTDSDGDANTNLILSQKRAISVKNALTNFYGIEPSRMQTDGKGENQPLNNNSNSVEKAENRRVEFLRL